MIVSQTNFVTFNMDHTFVICELIRLNTKERVPEFILLRMEGVICVMILSNNASVILKILSSNKRLLIIIRNIINLIKLTNYITSLNINIF